MEKEALDDLFFYAENLSSNMQNPFVRRASALAGEQRPVELQGKQNIPISSGTSARFMKLVSPV